MWQFFCIDEDGDVMDNNVSFHFMELTDSNGREIGYFQTDTKSIPTIGITPSNRDILQTEYTMKNTTEIEIMVSVYIQSTSGAQDGTNSPIIKLVSNDTCERTMQRSLSGAIDVGTVKFYLSCDGLTVGNNYLFNLTSEISAGETLNILNATVSGIETFHLSVESSNIPPIVAINEPVEDATVNGVITISWMTTDPNGDAFATNVSIDNTFIGLNLNELNTTLQLDTSNFPDGNHFINITSCENLTAERFCTTNIHNISIDNTPPYFINNETNIT